MIEFKDLIAMIVQKPGSNVRVTRYCDFLNAVIKSLKQGENIDESKLIELAELEGEYSLAILREHLQKSAMNKKVRCSLMWLCATL